MSSSEQCEKREKYWDELDEAEKMERMRREVKASQTRIAGLINKVKELESHEHSVESGRIVVPYGRGSSYSSRDGGGRPISNKKEVYF